MIKYICDKCKKETTSDSLFQVHVQCGEQTKEFDLCAECRQEIFEESDCKEEVEDDPDQGEENEEKESNSEKPKSVFDWERAKELLAQGKPKVEIAKILGINYKYCCSKIKQAQKVEAQGKVYSPGVGRRKSLNFDNEKALQLREEGKTVREIADFFGVTYSACYQRLRALDCPPVPKEPIDSGKVKALFRAGWNVPKIADEMKESEEAIIEILDR